jgi:Mitochondrial carrier protein
VCVCVYGFESGYAFIASYFARSLHHSLNLLTHPYSHSCIYIYICVWSRFSCPARCIATSVPVRFVVYYGMKDRLRERSASRWRTPFVESVLCGAAAGAVGTLLNNPIDVMKSRIQAQNTSASVKAKYSGRALRLLPHMLLLFVHAHFNHCHSHVHAHIRLHTYMKKTHFTTSPSQYSVRVHSLTGGGGTVDMLCCRCGGLLPQESGQRRSAGAVAWPPSQAAQDRAWPGDQFRSLRVLLPRDAAHLTAVVLHSSNQTHHERVEWECAKVGHFAFYCEDPLLCGIACDSVVAVQVWWRVCRSVDPVRQVGERKRER